MRHLGLIVILFSGFWNFCYSQNQCACDIYKKQFSDLESFLEKKDYESFDSQINSLKTIDVACTQKKWALLIEKFILKNEITKADSVSTLFLKSITKNTCEPVLALYNYGRGNLHLKNSSFDSACVFYTRVKQSAINIKDTLLQLKTMAKLALSFNKIRQPEKAIEYDRLGIKILAIYKNEKQLLQYYSNMNAHFGVWYDITTNKKYLDSIKKYIPVSIALARKLNVKSRIAQNHNLMAGILWVEKNYYASLAFCDSSIKYLNAQKDFKQLCSAYQKKCDAYIELKNYQKAYQFADSNLVFAKKEGDKLLEAVAFERMYECQKLLGNYSKALGYYERTVKIRDSLRTQEVTETVNALEKKYDQSENEKKINKLSFEKEVLHQQKEIDKLQIRSLIGIVAAIILLLVVIVFFYRQSVIKNQLNTIEIEQRLNRARMNPHFFFNALASLQNLSLSDSKKDMVPSFISKFSKIMRQSLESTFNEMDTIENEISFLTDYLELQKLRSENRFTYIFDMDDTIEPNELLMPGMILQPFIENSIEHGFKNISHEGLITTSFKIINNLLKITILDNGRGIDDNEKHKVYPSRATQIIRDRLFLLNKTYKSNATFVLTNIDNDKGIKVEISLPVIYKT